ncbi:MAG TPA: S8 family peptidase [Acidobacteriaceae bacterium]
MATDDRRDPPLLNPVLALRKEPVPETVSGGGKGADAIVVERLERQRRELASSIERLAVEASAHAPHAGQIHLVAKMFSDSLAPSWTPRGLFDPRFDCRLVAPARGGYLAEIAINQLAQFARFIRRTDTIEAKVAISRVNELRPFDAQELLRGQSLNAVWDHAAEVDGGRAFILWLAPFRDNNARASVIQTLAHLESTQVLLPTYPGLTLPGPRERSGEVVPVVSRDQTGLARAIRRYRNDGVARTFVAIPTRRALSELAASGTSFRIDPVRRIEVTAPGIGAEPDVPAPNPAAQPIVAVVDGGLTAQSYLPMEAWRAPPLVRTGVADHVHGNRVTSLVVHAYAWNNQLSLPDLVCRVATVQAVARGGGNHAPNPEQLIDYLRQMIRAYPEARVWNMSFNEVEPADDLEVVSYLGHAITELARETGILPIISIGNSSRSNPTQLCAPADCEAALTVGGRAYDEDGNPAGPCPVSLHGPGPDGMLKPDLSWYSHLRMLGGGSHIGSSFAVPLVSSLSAHTIANLKDPSADLVRALLINMADGDRHDPALGWGTPWAGHLPWTCAPGSVTLAWKAKLKPGFAYYWNDLPIPPEMIRGGKFVGSGKLTAILQPMVSGTGGPNYFATRLQVALQYQQASGKWGNLLGTMREDTAAELEARTDLAKWHPVRRHMRDFGKRGGIGFRGNNLRLNARIFARDLFQFGLTSHHELAEQDVAFVLTLSDGSDTSGIYNSMAQRLTTFVESAVVGQEIEIETRG